MEKISKKVEQAWTAMQLAKNEAARLEILNKLVSLKPHIKNLLQNIVETANGLLYQDNLPKTE